MGNRDRESGRVCPCESGHGHHVAAHRNPPRIRGFAASHIDCGSQPFRLALFYSNVGPRNLSCARRDSRPPDARSTVGTGMIDRAAENAAGFRDLAAGDEEGNQSREGQVVSKTGVVSRVATVPFGGDRFKAVAGEGRVGGGDELDDFVAVNALRHLRFSFRDVSSAGPTPDTLTCIK
mgnify:CR=1 FL=1